MTRIFTFLTAALILQSRAVAPPWTGHHSEVTALFFSRDGRRVLSGGAAGELTLWDPYSGQVLKTWKAHEEEITAAAMTRDGALIVSAGADRTLTLWDAAAAKSLVSIQGLSDEVRRVSLSPDMRVAATVSVDGTLLLWDLVRRGAPEEMHRGADLQALDAVFSPDGKKLAVGSWDQTLRLFDIADRKLVATWRGHARPVLDLAFSPDGASILSGSRDGTLRLWEVKTGRTLSVWEGHTGDVYQVEFSQDGRTAQSAAAGLVLKTWDTLTGKEISSWNGHRPGAPAVAFSPDGRLAVSAAEGGSLGLNDITAGAPPRPRWTGNPEETLGRMLFFERRLSGDDTFDCAKCHIPEKAFADGRELSPGYTETLYFRNTPTLLDAAAQNSLYWDSRFSGDELSALVRDHIAEAHFMNADGRLIVERLRQIPEYVKAFRAVYGREPTYEMILEALTAFLRTLNSSENNAAMSVQGKRGAALFNGPAGCAQCHGGRLLTDGRSHDRGVPENPRIFDDPLRHISFRRFFKLQGVEGYPNLREDIGLGAVTKKEEDHGKFRTPSLRTAALTAPYMHNGVFKTLEEAIAFENPDLTKPQVDDIAEFLRALNDPLPLYEPPPALEYALRPRPDPGPNLPSSSAESAAEPAALAELPRTPFPEDNPPSGAKVELGKLLFFEALLSGNSDASCAACHEPSMGWDDNSRVARGYDGTMHWRNSQTVLNVGHLTRLNWDGNKTSLEEQARSALTDNTVGNGDPAMIEERLAQIPRYVVLFREAFGVERPFFEGVLKAIATFLRVVPVSRSVPFDEYVRGNNSALSPAARRGLGLFQGKAGCIRCHNGAMATDQDFHATGVPRSPVFDDNALRQITLRYQHMVRGVPEEVYRNADTDPGLYLSTLRPKDIGKFRTAPLRELKVTAPYMHNGAFDTLADVVEFYDRGGGETPNKSSLLEPLGLLAGEKKDLVAFLESLSGEEIVLPRPDSPKIEGAAK